MNQLAQELNTLLEGTVCMELLSDFGKRFYFPKGIALQSVEAGRHAHRFNATIGMAFAEGAPVELSTVHEQLPQLSSSEAVAYAPSPGLPDLRDEWKRQIYLKNPTLDGVELSTPVVVPGLTGGITQVADLFIDPEDPVVVPDMFWGNYRLIIEVRREGKLHTFPFFNSEGKLNIHGFVETMRAAARNGKIVMIANFPNNPTGYSPDTHEAQTLASAVKELAEEGYKILAISDDAYFGLFFEEDTFTQSFFSLVADAHENILAVKVDGATKEDYVWGFRLGFVTFASAGMNAAQYEALNKKLSGAVRGSVSNCSKPAQSIILKSLRSATHEQEKQHWHGVLKERYLKVKEILAARTGGKELTPLSFNSGYFMSFDCGKVDAEKLRLELLHKQGIGTISIGSRHLRVAFSAIEKENLQALYDAIFAAADKLAG